MAFGVSERELADWISASDARRHWMAIKFSEFEGAEFDLDAMQFKERER